jgi:hypothetical protein
MARYFFAAVDISRREGGLNFDVYTRLHDEVDFYLKSLRGFNEIKPGVCRAEYAELLTAHNELLYDGIRPAHASRPSL